MVCRFGIIWGLWACTALVYAQQSEDWGTLFDRLTSHDPSVSDPARKEALEVIVPRLLKENPDLLRSELNAVVPQFARADQAVRLQASGIFATVAYLRSDSAIVLQPYFPRFLNQLKDENLRVRSNAAWALSSLHPSIPPQFLEPLMNAVQDPNSSVAHMAVGGVARFSPGSEQARSLLAKIAATGTRPEVRISALRGIKQFHLNTPQHISAVIESLSAEDRAVVMTGLDVISTMGRDAVQQATPKIRDLAGQSTDPEVRKMAQAILDNDR